MNYELELRQRFMAAPERLRRPLSWSLALPSETPLQRVVRRCAVRLVCWGMAIQYRVIKLALSFK